MSNNCNTQYILRYMLQSLLSKHAEFPYFFCVFCTKNTFYNTCYRIFELTLSFKIVFVINSAVLLQPLFIEHTKNPFVIKTTIVAIKRHNFSIKKFCKTFENTVYSNPLYNAVIFHNNNSYKTVSNLIKFIPLLEIVEYSL